MTSRHNQSLGTQLGALASFLPGFEAPGFAFTLSHAPREWSESALHFVKTAYAEGWVLTGFDWPSCKDTPEALGLRDDPKVKKPIHVFINKKKYDWDDPFGESEPGIPRSDENADIVHD